MRVLLSNTPLQFYHRTAFFFRDQGAINLSILATAIEAEHEVRVVDNWHYVLRTEGIFREIERFSPDVVGISHSSEVDTEKTYEVVRKIKRMHPDLRIVGGGQYPTMFPEESLANGFDYVVRGEGEFTFPELLRAIKGKCALHDVQGVSYRANGSVVHTPPRPTAKLNDLPYPSLRFTPKHRSWYFPGQYASVIETARGCPFTCDFCIVTAYFQHAWQRRTNDSLLSQIKKIKYGLGVNHFYFLDESWGIRYSEYMEFCQRLIDEKLDIRWFPSGMRTDTIVKHPDLMALAARAGMYGTLVGFESYSDRTLDSVHKRSSTSNNRRASEIMRANDIIVYGVHIYGLPGEKNFRPTYEEGRRRSDIFCISMFSLLPGTPLFKRAEQEETLVKIPAEKRLYPYSYFMRGEGRDQGNMTRDFMLWHLRYHVSLRNLLETLFSRGVKRRFKLADYLSCIQYAYFLIFQELSRRLHNLFPPEEPAAPGSRMPPREDFLKVAPAGTADDRPSPHISH